MQKKFTLRDIDHLLLLGSRDSNLRFIQKYYQAKIIARGDNLLFDGEASEVKQLEKLFSELAELIHRNGGLTESDIDAIIQLTRKKKTNLHNLRNDQIVINGKKDSILTKTEGQKSYNNAVINNDIVFVIGPAGTGKTYLAVAFAVGYLNAHDVDRIVLTRPAVEAGEKLGFLPGDFKEKVDPYLRPLYDALYDMLPAERLRKMIAQDIIEIVPLAYMRGRTLNNAFVILDEAQNTSENQMKMFLTRLGVKSKAIITGDITQIDLPEKNRSGLTQIRHVLKGVNGIQFVYMDERDVVRHRLVKDIIVAYDQYDQSQKD